jgi:hypothetical protein
VATASLLASHGLLPVLGATLVLACSVLFAANGVSWLYGIRKRRAACADLRGASILAVLAFLLLSCGNWIALFLTIRQFGPTGGVMVSLASGVMTMWVGQFVFRSKHHRAPGLGTLALATCLLVLAALVIAKTKFMGNAWKAPETMSEALFLAWPVAMMVMCSVGTSTLRTMITDAKEARERNRRAVRAEALVCMEMASASAVVVGVNLGVDDGRLLLAILPASLDPATWSWAHWGVVWVGVVNTALGVLVLTRLTNEIGIPIATAVGQGRPMLAEIMQAGLGMTMFSAPSLIDMTAATALLVTAARVLWGKGDPKAPLQ